MSSKKRKKRRREPVTAPVPVRTRSLWDWAIMGVLALCGVAIGFGWRIINPPKPAAVTAERRAEPADEPALDKPAIDKPAIDEPATATSEVPLSKLQGRWVRTEGGFVIDIQDVAADGKLTAAYLNPMPIHVAKAQATYDATGTTVFIELRDVNYPGSTYDLTYDPRADRLTGRYFQAVQQQTYAVQFDRAR